MSVFTIGLPYSLDITRPLVERKPIAQRVYSLHVLSVRRCLPSSFAMLVQRERKERKSIRNGNQSFFLGNTEEIVQVILGVPDGDGVSNVDIDGTSTL
jgi:hypothetical protein